MKKISKRVVCLLLVLSMMLMLPTKTTSLAATKKAPKLNKTKLSLEVGKTANLKVKNTKKSVKWSSSKKSVATVTKKGKVKAKKAGKTTITAKVGKKKLKCKVTVTAKNTATATKKPTNTPSGNTGNNNSTGTVVNTPKENHIKEITVMSSNSLEVTFSAEQKLEKTNFKIEKKKIKKGNYNQTLEIDEITSLDNKSYFIRLEGNVSEKDYIRVTATGLTKTGTSQKEILYRDDYISDTEEAFRATTGEADDWSFYLNGYGYKTLVSADLPEGISYNLYYYSSGSTQIEMEGTLKETGIKKGTIVYKDEWGVTYLSKITWVVGSEDTITAYCEESYGVYKRTSYTSMERYFMVAGGSGAYEYKVLNSDASVNASSNYIFKNFDNAGTFQINVQVTDENNSELTTTFTWVVNIKEARRLTVRLLDGTGNTIIDAYHNITVSNQDENTPYYCEDNYDYVYEGEFLYVWGIDGVYDIYVETDGYEYVKRGYQINGKDATLDIKLPLYRTEVKADNVNYEIDSMNWYDNDEKVRGEGAILYLPVGTHQLHAKKVKNILQCNAAINCEIKPVAVNKVTAKITTEEKIYGELTLDAPQKVVLDSTEKCFSFTPTEDGKYEFYSSSSSTCYTYGKLYNPSFSTVNYDYAGTNGHFSFTANCKAGKTYYLGVYAYYASYIGDEVDLKVEKVES